MTGSFEVLIGGTWGHSLGTYGTVTDLTWTTRWGAGACGMYEASWSMPLDADDESGPFRRGQLAEIHDGPWRIGSSLVLSEPVPGDGLDQPWQFTATGLGREVEGNPGWPCLDGSGNTSASATVVIDQAIADGLQWAGRDATVPSAVFGSGATTEPLNSMGSLFDAIGDSTNTRWGVWQNNEVGFLADPTTPSWHVVPGSSALGTADDDYATVVYVRYADSATGTFQTAKAPASPSATEARFGRKALMLDQTNLGPITATAAGNIAAGVLANYGGRLNWVGSLTLTSQELLSPGGVPADLSLVEAGQMMRLHGEFPDLLETPGETWVDIVIGQATWTAGAPTISLTPLGAAARDLASVIEASGGSRDAA